MGVSISEDVKTEVEAILLRFRIESDLFWTEIEKLNHGEIIGMSQIQEMLDVSKPAVIQSMDALIKAGVVKKSWRVNCGFCGENVFDTDDIDRLTNETRMCKACGSPNTLYFGNAEIYYEIIK